MDPFEHLGLNPVERALHTRVRKAVTVARNAGLADDAITAVVNGVMESEQVS